jgi:hypothetical protein
MERITPTQQWSPLSVNQRIEAPQPTVTEDNVRGRAYELYLKRGRNRGDQLWDWLQAERELRDKIRMSAYLGRS